MNKNQMIQLISNLITDHENAGYCINYDMADDELNKDIQKLLIMHTTVEDMKLS